MGRGLTQEAVRRNAAGAFLLSALLVLHPTPVQSQGDATVVRVVRVIDGNTIEVCCIAGRPEASRYIGVNAPETHHPAKGVEWYKEASTANAKLVA